MEQLIEQIVNRIPTLTEAEVTAMNASALPSDAIIEANDVSGEETLAAMAQLGSNVDPGVYSVARTAILGIIAKGKVPDEVSAILVRAWTDIVEPLNVSRQTVESPEILTEPTEEVPGDAAEEIVDIPVDTIPPVSEETPGQTAEIVDTPTVQP